MAATRQHATDEPGAPRRGPIAWARANTRWSLAIVGGAVAAVAFVLSYATSNTEFQRTLRAPGGGGSAQVDVYSATVGHVIALETSDLPELPERSYYELWLVGAGDSPARPDRISAGTFHPDATGHAKVQFAAAFDPARYTVMSVTAEPGDGDPGATGPEVLRAAGG